MKICKQCGLYLAEESFRPYYPRGKGLRSTKQGRNTICLTCERFNALATNLWKKEKRTDAENKTLEQIAEYYRALQAKGLKPLGSFAREVLRDSTSPQAAPRRGTAGTLQSMLAQVHTDQLLVDLTQWLSVELTEDQEVYDAVALELEGRVQEARQRGELQYDELLWQVKDRFEEYFLR